MRAVLLVMGGSAILALLLAAGILKWEWNYVLARPGLFGEVNEVKSIESVGYFDAGWYGEKDGVREHMESQLLGEEPYRDPYYFLCVRSLMAARNAGIDPMSAPEMSTANVDAYRKKFFAEELVVKSASGYDSNSGLNGLVVSFASSDGRTYNLLAARGGQVSNDHYPYYEALFDDQGNLLKSQMFYFDVAGMEGADGWPVLILMAGLI